MGKLWSHYHLFLLLHIKCYQKHQLFELLKILSHHLFILKVLFGLGFWLNFHLALNFSSISSPPLHLVMVCLSLEWAIKYHFSNFHPLIKNKINVIKVDSKVGGNFLWDRGNTWIEICLGLDILPTQMERIPTWRIHMGTSSQNSWDFRIVRTILEEYKEKGTQFLQKLRCPLSASTDRTFQHYKEED